MQPHEQSLGDGYRLRLGHSVPGGGANLAYIGNTVQDVTSGAVHITDNHPYAESMPFEEIMYPDDGYILRSTFQSDRVHSTDILVTNVFANDTNRTPLYYYYDVQGLIYKTTTAPTVYTGQDISIVKLNDNITTEKHMVVLYPAETPGFSYAVVFTNFTGARLNVYKVVYPRYDTEATMEQSGFTEVMSLAPIFTKVDYVNPWPGAHAGEKVYALVQQSGGGHLVYVSTAGTQQPTDKRTAQSVNVTLDINIDSNCSHGAAKTLNVGLIPVTGYPGQSIVGSLLAMYQRTPSYLTLRNPHPYLMRLNERSDPNWINTSFTHDRGQQDYWLADLNMPLHHMYDYDLLIIAGRGPLVLTTEQASNLSNYLERGGTIWIDNNGMVDGSQLSLTSFPAEFTFTYDNTLGSSTLQSTDIMQLLTRYNVMAPGQMQEFSDDTVGIEFPFDVTPTGDEPDTLIWREFSTQTQLKLCLYEYQSRGRILFSAVGIMHGIVNNQSGAIKLAVNVLLRMVENRWMSGGRIRTSLLEKASLLRADYQTDTLTLPYVNAYSNDQVPEIIARRQLAPGILRKALHNYMPQLKPYDRMKFYPNKDAANVHFSPNKDYYEPGDILYAYTKSDTKPWNVGSGKDINPRYPDVSFYFTIEAFVYEKPPGIDTYQPSLDFNSISQKAYQATISAYDGITNLGPGKTVLPFTAALPGEKSGTAWIDRANVYYRMRLGRYVGGVWRPGTANINLILYDTVNERYVVTRNAEIVISACDITSNMIVQAYTHTYAAVETNDYAVRTLPATIQLSGPVETQEYMPWYLRIRNGHFSRTTNITMRNGEPVRGIATTYRYRLPEFNRQIFSPQGQYKTMKRTREVATFIDNDLIRVSRTPLVVSQSLPLTVIRRDYEIGYSKNELLTTTDGYTFSGAHANWLMTPSPIINEVYQEINYTAGTVVFGEYRSDIRASYHYAKDTVLDVLESDAQSGIIRLGTPVDHTDNILVTYHYDQHYLSYKGYWDGTIYWHLDLNPAPGHYITYPTSTGPDDVETYKLLGEVVYIYLLPYTDGTTTNDHTVRHVFGEANWNVIQQAHPQALLLGKAQVREAATAEDLVVIDTRQRGGGLRQSVTKDDMDYLANWNNEPSASDHFWDVGAWNHTAYQTQGVVSIAIPKSIKIEHGGQFTEDHIQDIVRKHLAFGVVPVIEYTDTASKSFNATALLRRTHSANFSAVVTII